MKKSDRALGMDQPISRRDFIQGAGATVAGALAPGLVMGDTNHEPPRAAQDNPGYYPPVLTGLRGSHPGSFETAHARARLGKTWPSPMILDEYYDLVVVGAGISGLSAAWRYRELAGPDARILVLDNHDDFGGHAKRNEFHYNGHTRLAWGGAINLEYPHYSEEVLSFIGRLGVDIPRLKESFDFNFSASGQALDPMLYLDAGTFGSEARLRGFHAWGEDPRQQWLAIADKLPLASVDRDSLKSFLTRDVDLLEGMSEAQRLHYLRRTSYLDFITTRGGVTPGAARVSRQMTHGLWGVGTDAVDVANSFGSGLPGIHAVGPLPAALAGDSREGFAMFPDGNASVARMLVRAMVPGSATGKDMDDIVNASFDYAALDRAGQAVRIRLGATAVQARNITVKGTRPGVSVDYVRDGQAYRVNAGCCILAGYNNMVPALVPDLPTDQVAALGYAEKSPMIVTNILLGDGRAVEKARFGSAHSPGRLHSETWTLTGFGMGPGNREFDPATPLVIQFYGGVAAPEAGPVARHQYVAGRHKLLGWSFEDLEREVREHLAGLLAESAFDPARDIKALTVNRWPHGYAYEYISLHDPDWEPGQAPHEIGRRRHGRIAIANSDAGAYAYLDSAIEQGLRAVNELISL
jgi:spermidine dehydrogenase